MSRSWWAKGLVKVAMALSLACGGHVSAQGYSFKNYNVAEGLAQSQVNAIAQDRRGYLWMATEGGGVSVFDGLDFQTLTTEEGLFSNEVFDVMEDRRGAIWLGHSDGGLTVLDGQSVNRYRAPGGVSLKGNTIVRNLADGRVLVGSQGGGLRIWDGSAFQVLDKEHGLLSDTVHDIVADPGGAYIATRGGLNYYGKGGLQKVVLNGLNAGDFPRALCLDGANRLMFATNDMLWTVVGNHAQPLISILELGLVNSMFTDWRGRTWICHGSGFAMYDNGRLEHYEGREGLWETGAYRAMEDNFQNIWVGTDGGGVSRLSQGAWVMYGEDTPLEQRAVFAIEEVQPNEYLIGTERGLFHLKDDVLTKSDDPVLAEMEIFDILTASDRKRVYLMGSSGVYEWAGGKLRKMGLKGRLGSAVAYSAIEDADSTIWFGTNRGVFMLSSTELIDLGLISKRFDRQATGIMTDQKGRKWVIYGDQGLLLWDHRLMAQELNLPENYSNNRAMAIAQDLNGHVWVGTRNGILRWGDDGCYLSSRDGLLGSVVYVLQPDDQGNLWVGTERGMNRVILDYESNVQDVKTYSADEGFKGQECNQGASLVDSDGRLWVGTVYGLCRYDPAYDVQPDIQPRLSLRGLSLNLEEVDWEEMGFEVQPWTHMPSNLELSADQNHLRFDFKATTMWRAEKVRYKYILEGLETKWSRPAPEGHATYQALPPGEYTFKVKASDASGRWTEAVGFSFKVKTPFYRTFWFLSGCVLFAFGMVFLAFRLRLRAAERARERLERMVRQRTEELENANRVKGEFLAKMSHEIRTPMNGVIGMTELIQRTKLDDRQLKMVQNIRVSGQNLLALINDILDFSKIESGKMELESVPVDVRRVIEEVLDILAYGAYSKGLELLVWVDPEIRGPVLGDPARLKQVVLNLVGNAVKFTPEGRILVQAQLHERTDTEAVIRISVEDSGIGIPKDKQGSLFESFTQVDASTTRKYGGTGLGLAISHSLARMMGGEMWVESEEGRGSEFIFTIRAGLSAPWHDPGSDHPAANLSHLRVGAAVHDPVARVILQRHLQHWGVELGYDDSLSTLSDRLLAGDFDYVMVDTRSMRAEPGAVETAKGLLRLCAEKGVPLAILCDPGLAPDLQEHLNPNAWLLTKPWKRDDILMALRKERPAAPAASALEHDQRLAQTMPLDIVLAEDNPINVEVATGMLRNFGYTARVAGNGAEVIALVEERIPDVVFMDVQMPVMDGLQATREIVKRLGARRPKIVAMTANAMESDRQRCLEAGMDEFITKPFAPAELVHMLHWVAGRLMEETRRVEPEPVVEEAPALEEVAGVEVLAEAPKPARLLDLSMLEAASGGESSFVAAILGKLAKNMPASMAELHEALAKEEWNTVRAVAHKAKSSSAYTGVEAIRQGFKEIEHAAMEGGDRAAIPALLAELEVLVTQVVAEIGDELDSRMG